METEQRTGLIYDFELRFPPLSRTVSEVTELLADNSMPDTDRLLEIVHLDPIVVASVLKRINSAFYGMRRHFDDIRKAILMIGFIEVCNIVLASGYVGLRKSIRSKAQETIIDRIMRMSICSGYYADLLARHLDLQNKSSAFTGGLLHSIGRFVLLYNIPEPYLQLCQDRPDVYIPPAELEREAFGVDHSTLGAVAAKHWNFPPLIISLIESYHNPGHLPDAEHRKLALALSTGVDIAHELCRAMDAARSTVVVEDPENPLDDFPLPFAITIPRSLQQLARTARVDAGELEQVVNFGQKEALHYVELMIRA